MMREISFRGKTLKEDNWICGSLLVYPDGACFICCPNEDNANVLDKYLVIPETVGQYTGLCDKNGMRILEGDIVKLSGHSSPGKVEWSCGLSGFFITINSSHFELASYLYHHLEVIGNVYDNPELLEGGENNGDKELHNQD